MAFPHCFAHWQSHRHFWHPCLREEDFFGFLIYNMYFFPLFHGYNT